MISQSRFSAIQVLFRLFHKLTVIQLSVKTLPLKQFCQAVYDRILQQNLLAEVCGSCEWAKLCQEKWADGDFNRLLLASQPAD